MSFDSMKQPQDPPHFRLKVVSPEPPVTLNVEECADEELIKLGQEVKRLEQCFSNVFAISSTNSGFESLIKREFPPNTLARRFLDVAKAKSWIRPWSDSWMKQRSSTKGDDRRRDRQH
jgi:hypothetical protein